MAPDDRHAVVQPQSALGDVENRIVYLDQGWDATDSLWFYNTTQGSNLLAYDLFLHLEQADNEKRFRDNANITRYRYLPIAPHWDNPDGLPLGFVKDSHKGEDYVGFTCAACHTAQVNYKGTGMRIDGGPALSDMEGFLLALQRALAATLADEGKFSRLLKAIDSEPSDKSAGALRARLTAANQRLLRENQHNHSPAGAYGYGRVDAFGRIFNRVFERLTPDNPNNVNPSNAPVSYPFLWDTPLHDFVQWNGLISNEKNQALARNVGEVLGAFAHFDLKTGRSSVVTRNLIRLERQIRDKLYSPQWPDVLPPIDQNLAAEGRKVFDAYRCGTCHADIGDRKSGDRRVIAHLATLDRIGTDPMMARNAATNTGLSGFWEGKAYSQGGGKHEHVTPASKALGSAVKRVIITPDYDHTLVRRWLNLAYDLAVGVFDKTIKNPIRHINHEPVRGQEQVDHLLVYKARPLNGIWATAPYLHNGSVPNLYELLLPSCAPDEQSEGPCRAASFHVGSREFDPVKVGFDTTAQAGSYVFDTSLPGNSHAGHEYASGKTAVIKLDAQGRPLRNAQGDLVQEWLTPITDAQRWALVEYLKTL
jgi:mono/diheme cytochrome c family protein